MKVTPNAKCREGYTPRAQPSFFKFESEAARWVTQSRPIYQRDAMGELIHPLVMVRATNTPYRKPKQ